MWGAWEVLPGLECCRRRLRSEWFLGAGGSCSVGMVGGVDGCGRGGVWLLGLMGDVYSAIVGVDGRGMLSWRC